jgi:hypothetical protein
MRCHQTCIFVFDFLYRKTSSPEIKYALENFEKSRIRQDDQLVISFWFLIKIIKQLCIIMYTQGLAGEITLLTMWYQIVHRYFGSDRILITLSILVPATFILLVLNNLMNNLRQT